MKPNEVYGKWKTISIDTIPNQQAGIRWNCKCKCECGRIRSVTQRSLLSGKSKSCGCSSSSKMPVRKSHPIYNSWMCMRRRCYSIRDGMYKHYGGRGITVCDRWNNSFLEFYKDMMPTWEIGRTINRINNDGNYEPSNCNWSTPTEQAQNTTRTRLLTFNGKTQCVHQWSKESGIHQCTLYERVYKNIPVEIALTKKHLLTGKPLR